MKYLRVQFGDTSSANNSLKIKENEVNIAEIWNPSADNPKDMGGFNFSEETKILRWLVRGDTIYDVEIPEDAEVIDVENESAPHGVFRSNKIILSNPRKVTDEMAMEFYKKSDLPEKSYYKAMAGCAVRGYKNTTMQILKDKVNESNILLVLEEVCDFLRPGRDNGTGDKDLIKSLLKKLFIKRMNIQIFEDKVIKDNETWKIENKINYNGKDYYLLSSEYGYSILDPVDLLLGLSKEEFGEIEKLLFKDIKQD